MNDSLWRSIDIFDVLKELNAFAFGKINVVFEALHIDYNIESSISKIEIFFSKMIIRRGGNGSADKDSGG